MACRQGDAVMGTHIAPQTLMGSCRSTSPTIRRNAGVFTVVDNSVEDSRKVGRTGVQRHPSGKPPVSPLPNVCKAVDIQPGVSVTLASTVSWLFTQRHERER